MVAQIIVLIDESPEGLAHLGIFNKLTVVERTDLNLAVVGRDIHQVVANTIAVHIVGVGIGKTVGRIACVEEVDLRATSEALMREGDVIADRGDELIGHHIAGTLDGGEVRTVDGIQALPGGDGVATRQTGYFLLPCRLSQQTLAGGSALGGV